MQAYSNYAECEHCDTKLLRSIQLLSRLRDKAAMQSVLAPAPGIFKMYRSAWSAWSTWMTWST